MVRRRLVALRVVVGIVVAVGSAGLDDIERESALEFHTGCAKDGTQRARGATLLPDDLPDVAGSDVKAKDSCFLISQDFHPNRIGIIYQGPGNLRHQGLHFRGSEVAVRDCDGIRHTYTSRE